MMYRFDTNRLASLTRQGTIIQTSCVCMFICILSLTTCMNAWLHKFQRYSSAVYREGYSWFYTLTCIVCLQTGRAYLPELFTATSVESIFTFAVSYLDYFFIYTHCFMSFPISFYSIVCYMSSN